VGLAAALGASRLIRVSFGVPAHDAGILATVALALCAAALAANLGPAVRDADRPREVLRAE
jgi:hypothetical protein